METVLKIRRMHQVDGQSISAIAKVTGLSRNTVRKYLRQPPSVPPKYHRNQPARPKLGEFEQTLTQWLGPRCQAAQATTPLCQTTLRRPTTPGLSGGL